MDVQSAIETLRSGSKPNFPAQADTLSFAIELDRDSSLVNFREDFIIPSKADLTRQTLHKASPSDNDIDNPNNDACLYFCGNSLGLQPKAIRRYVDAYLQTWASVGVHGHFRTLEGSPLGVAYQDLAEDCSRRSAAVVGALASEVTVMNTLTANLHLTMASFYRPTGRRTKVMLEWRPFPSDWYAIESQIEWHGLRPSEEMVLLRPDDEAAGGFLLSTAAILAAIDRHANELALILLPGIQYYSGQLLDIPAITAHARSRGIVIGWDLAHAAGNVELRLHDWNVDFACWCTYKYMNSGAGAIAGAFVHERHGGVTEETQGGEVSYRPRLKGWYGGDKSVRFLMDNNFKPTPGAAGFQLSNPSVIDLSCLSASLSVFDRTSMAALRSKSLLLTAYAEFLLDRIAANAPAKEKPFRIITPRDPLQRGAQLSVLLAPGLLDEYVQPALEKAGIVCDKRKPDVIRIAPAPLYNTFHDVWEFMRIFETALPQHQEESIAESRTQAML